MKNEIELLGIYGNDETHAQSAWTSTNRDLTDDKIKRIPKLLRYLAVNKHHTPFEKSSLHFLVTADIASHIHCLKHRIGVSINGECLQKDSLITFVDIDGQTSPKLKQPIEKIYKSCNEGIQRLKNRRCLKHKRIRVLNEDTGFFETSNIKDVYKSGIKDIYKITLKNGKQLKCSKNHRVFTNNGWATLNNKKLRLGISVACNGVVTHDFYRTWTFPEYSEIIEIKYIGKEETYDIEVDGKHKNFVANDIVVHNSARYKELNDDRIYIPTDWDKNEQDLLQKHCERCFKEYHSCITRLTNIHGINRTRAKESARFYLPYANQIKFDIMFNFRSFIHFLILRNAPDAQIEIQDIAKEMLRLVKNTDEFKHSLRAFGY